MNKPTPSNTKCFFRHLLPPFLMTAFSKMSTLRRWTGLFNRYFLSIQNQIFHCNYKTFPVSVNHTFPTLGQTLFKLHTSTNKVMKRIIALIHISGSLCIHQLHTEKLLPWRIRRKDNQIWNWLLFSELSLSSCCVCEGGAVT